MAVTTTRNARRVSKTQLRGWYNAFQRGERSKVEIERTELGDTTSRGKYITRLWAQELGIRGLGRGERAVTLR